MRIDTWSKEREAATTLANGLRVKADADNTRGGVILKMWRPKAIKPFAHYRFKRFAELNDYLAKAIAGHDAHEKSVSDRQAARHGSDEDLKKLEVGQIYCYSWGYEQTNVDFFQAVEIKGRTVKLREISCKTVDRGPGYSSMSDHRLAVKDSFVEKAAPILKRVYFYSGRPSFSMPHGCLSLWDGSPMYCSWYA